MKVYLDIEPKPWKTWLVELWKESRKGDYGIEISPTPDEDCIVVDRFTSRMRCTGVPSSMWHDKSVIDNKCGFSIVVDGKKYSDELTKMMRVYFSMCLKDDPENDDGLLCMDDVNIFSATDLPFETFNNVYFQGLQPNPKMYNAIKNSKVFMSPSDEIPWTAIDALFLGTPIIIKDTGGNGAASFAKVIFPQSSFYKDEVELAQKIKYFSDISVTDPEYIKLVNDGFDFVYKWHTPRNSLKTIKEFVGGEYDTI